MTIRSLVLLPAVLALGALSACSGGGGGRATPPVPTASPTPGPDTCTSTSIGRSGAFVSRLASRASGGVVPDQLYVRYRSSAGTRGVQSVEKAASVVRGVDIGTIQGDTLRAVVLAPGADASQVAAAMKQDAAVTDVMPVHYRSLTSDPAAGANDQYFDNVDQWYLYKTNVVKTALNTGAWNLTTGSAAVSVAIIDTGVDLSGAALGGHDFVVDFAESVVNGVTTVGQAAVQDTNGHGTNVAGLAVAQANNGYGYAGVGYTTHLQAYKIFPDATPATDCQTASTADEAKAINDAVTHGAAVISLSLGSPQNEGSDPGEVSAINNALAHNVVVVAANGNEFGKDPTGQGALPDYPAGYPGVIAVGASAVQNATANVYASITAEKVASYSNSGPTLVAPGGDAVDSNDNDLLHWIEGYSTTTAAFAKDQCTNSGSPPTCRVLFNGTSQATPQVAGVVALMKAFHTGGPATLTPAAVKSIFASGAGVDVLPGISAARQGAGRLNGGKAVAAAH